MAELTLRTKEGTTTLSLGHESEITIDSPGGKSGTPAGDSRRPHTFGPFRTGLGHPPGFQRVSSLKKSGHSIVVTEAGTPPAGVLDAHGKPVSDETADPWTEQTKVPIDDSSVLVVESQNTRIALAGLKSISLDEAA
jgi:hypothetical protein